MIYNEFALLEDTKTHSKHLFFYDKKDEIIAYDQHALLNAFQQIEKAMNHGYYLCGYIAYEAGLSLIDRPIISTKTKKIPYPLLHFNVYSNVKALTKEATEQLLMTHSTDQKCAFKDIHLSENETQYIEKIKRILHYIYEGDTYQVNYTIRLWFTLIGSPITLYRMLRQQQPVEYSALLKYNEQTFLSLSPELFIKNDHFSLSSKPMKGTTARLSNTIENNQRIRQMQSDPKIISENVMIVDLIRNDMARIAIPKTIKTTALFDVECYKTVNQMTSTITGKLDSDFSFSSLWQKLFPCGSITGAPKIRTMEIIDQLETQYRGIYTGTIGYIMPNKNFCFNVAIRTLHINKNNTCTMGIGGGIVHASEPKMEYQECLTKAQFLTKLFNTQTIF